MATHERERLIELIAYAQSDGWTYDRLAAETGVSATRWSNVKNNKAEPRLSEAAALLKLYPEFSTWLMTGRIDPANGQISPEIERTRKDSPGAEEAS